MTVLTSCAFFGAWRNERWARTQWLSVQTQQGIVQEQRAELDTFIREQREKRVILLSQGEIEDYLPQGYKSTERIVELVRPDNLRKWLQASAGEPCREELHGIVFDILGASEKGRSEVQTALLAQPELGGDTVDTTGEPAGKEY